MKNKNKKNMKKKKKKQCQKMLVGVIKSCPRHISVWCSMGGVSPISAGLSVASAQENRGTNLSQLYVPLKARSRPAGQRARYIEAKWIIMWYYNHIIIYV